MPFKHNASRRHHIPKVRRRITNWPSYEAGLRRRGDLTFWVDEAAVSGWRAPRRTSPGGQRLYADMAIEVVLTLRLVFHLALRQVEGFTRSVLRLLGLEIAVPDHSTLSRRGRGFAGRQPRAVRHDRPVDVVLDSTGLQIFGQGGAGQGSARVASGIPAEGSGMPRSMAASQGSGGSCTWLSMLKRVRSWRTF